MAMVLGTILFVHAHAFFLFFIFLHGSKSPEMLSSCTSSVVAAPRVCRVDLLAYIYYAAAPLSPSEFRRNGKC